MVNLVEHGWAEQKDVARAFGCSTRSVRRHQERFQAAGLAALGRAAGYPRSARDFPRSVRVAHVAAWLWPLLIWSKMGVRESLQRTGPLVFSCPRPLRRQFVALWLSGVLIAMVTGSGLALRFLLAGDMTSLAALAAGAVFVPSLALALGVWTESSRAFEALYTVWWYVGPANRIAALDYSGAWAGADGRSSAAVFATLAALLLAAAAFGRRRQIRG